MRTSRIGIALLLAASCRTANSQTERSLVILFGPGSAEHARQAARVGASNARRWLKQPGSSAELRRAGTLDAVAIEPRTPEKRLEELFQSAARLGREADLNTYLTALDTAAQSLVNRAGPRLLVAVAEAPPLSRDPEQVLNDITERCRANAVRVIVLDLGGVSGADGQSGEGPFAELASKTGGALIRDARLLENTLLTTASAAAAISAQPEPPQPAPAATEPPSSSDLPVHTRFVRTSSRATQSWGTERSVSAGLGGITERTGGAITESTTGPTRGYFLVEAPLSALEFKVDDGAGAYIARARITQIARNRQGKPVWRASKTVELRGPLRKLNARKEGNLYYMREVLLPAGQYSLEATVEDLIASKTGSAREPLRTSVAVPGFDVSDAMIVRPFSGARDRFEADQVLEYNGDAIAPLLDPVYDAGKPFDVNVYAVLFPDKQGAQPQLSLEVAQNNRVIGRTALPFSDRIFNSATEGKTGTIGEQKNQFPYMATLRGVKLGGGDYEARLIVRQGRNVLTRTARFHVNGPANTAANVVAPGSAQTASAAAAADEDSADIVMPQVDPTTMSSTASLPADEQRRFWEEASAEALSYASRLPNFRCRRETRRLAAPIRSNDQFTVLDSIVEELAYENGRESYRTLQLNGEKTMVEREQLKGVQSRGEFGAMLRYMFRPDISERYQYAGRAMSGGVMCLVFDIDVPMEKSNFVLNTQLKQAVAAYRGRIMIEEETGLVRRITMQSTALRKDFELQSPTLSLEYGMVRIGDQDYLLPLRSVLQLRQGKRVIRNETLFRNYRKFEAESEIKFRMDK